MVNWAIFAAPLAAIALASSPTLARVTQSFNLECSGVEHMAVRGETKAWTAEIHVDLAAHTYCGALADCTGRLKIERIEPGKIYFFDDEPKNDGGDLAVLFVDRATGALHYAITGPVFDSIEATCKKKPFSGFPKNKF